MPATSRYTTPRAAEAAVGDGGQTSQPPAARAGERGSILLAALVVTMLAATLLIGAAYDATMRLRMRDALQDGAMALVCAQAGLENAQRMASTDTTLTTMDLAPLWISNKPVGQGAVSVVGIDPGDGLMAPLGASLSSSADTVRLTATGNVGPITRTLAAEYVRLPHGAMKQAVYSRTTIDLGGVTVEGRLRANGAVTLISASDVFGDITTLVGQTVTAILDDSNTNIIYTLSTLGMPAVDFTWFRDAGERITLPAGRTITDRYYGPGDCMGATPSPEGIYWIDATGGTLTLQNIAVVGTLAILNASTVYIGSAAGATTNYYHEPADPLRMPALLVQGNLSMYVEGNPYSFTILGTTYNVTCGVNGLIYCTGTFWGPQVNATLPGTYEGAIVANEVHLRGPSTLIRHDSDYNQDPITECTLSGLRLIPGTRREL